MSTALFYEGMFCSLTCEGRWLKLDAPNWDTQAISQFNDDFGPYVGKVKKESTQ